MNQQFISVTEARASFRAIIDSVTREGKEVVLLKDSKPEAVIVPYTRFVKSKDTESAIWELRFEKYLKKARKIGSVWAAKKGFKPQKMTEEELYEEVEKA